MASEGPKDPDRLEAKRLASQRYRQNNHARIKEMKRAWNNNNKDTVHQYYLKRRNKTSYEMRLYKSSLQRAKKYDMEFNLDPSDISVPEYCPILGIPLFSNETAAGPNSPSVDRIDSSKGYIKGNIQIISHKANTIKSNASVDDLEKVYLYMKGLSHDCH